MEPELGAVGLECVCCGERKTMGLKEARFTVVALTHWCCPHCRTMQPWPVQQLQEHAPARVTN